MTADQPAMEDEITAVRLDWLAAEAQLAQLLPPLSPAWVESTAKRAEITAAIDQAEAAHRAYLTSIRKWAGLPATDAEAAQQVPASR